MGFVCVLFFLPTPVTAHQNEELLQAEENKTTSMQGMYVYGSAVVIKDDEKITQDLSNKDVQQKKRKQVSTVKNIKPKKALAKTKSEPKTALPDNVYKKQKERLKEKFAFLVNGKTSSLSFAQQQQNTYAIVIRNPKLYNNALLSYIKIYSLKTNDVLYRFSKRHTCRPPPHVA